jgi:hypothetical protein
MSTAILFVPLSSVISTASGFFGDGVNEFFFGLNFGAMTVAAVARKAGSTLRRLAKSGFLPAHGPDVAISPTLRRVSSSIAAV